MRKSKIVLLMAALLACVMLLSSCGIGGTVKFEKIVDGSLYKDQDPAYATSSVVAGVKDADYKGSNGKLAYFVGETDGEGDKYDKHMVYDMVANQVVYTVNEGETTNITISLGETENDVNYFVVATTTYSKDGENVDRSKYTQKTELFNAAGSSIASAARATSASTVYDLVYFDGKCYTAAEDGSINYAFDYSPLAKLPEITYATEDYYFAIVIDDDYGAENSITVYDKALQLVGYMDLPSYATAMGEPVPLENGNVFMQYGVIEDTYSDDYDLIQSQFIPQLGAVMSIKTSLYSVIFDAKKGEFKEVDCEYTVGLVESADDEDWAEYNGFGDEIANLVYAYPIVDKKIDSSASAMIYGTVTNSGKIKAIDFGLGAPVTSSPYSVAQNRWIIETTVAEYLVDEKGNVIGEISKAGEYSNDDYFVVDGKLFNKTDLSVAYDYAAANLSIEKVFDHCILFENTDGELIAYANGTATTIINKDNKAKLELTEELALNSNIFVLKDTTEEGKIKYQIYNEAGASILTLNVLEGFSAHICCSYEGVAIVRNYVVDEGVPTVNYLRLG